MSTVAVRWLFAHRAGVLVLLLALALSSGCGPEQLAPQSAQAATAAGILTLGDIDPDEPATRVRRIQPLADYLAQRLGDHGIGRGRVVIARNIEEMARLLASGEVDLLFDSPYPVLAVNALAGSETFLLRRASGDAQYSSVFIARKDSGIHGMTDLAGKVMVFQEPHSTSGFLLPAAMLSERSFKLQLTTRPDSRMPDDAVGCYFSGDEENTVELVYSGRAPAGAISEPDYRALPPSMRAALTVLERTQSVPRQLVAVRKGIDYKLANAVRQLLLSESTLQ